MAGLNGSEPTVARGDDAWDEGTAARRLRMLSRANEHIQLAGSYIPEVKQLLQRIKSSNPNHTGVPAFVRSLESNHRTLERLIPQLSEPTVDDETLKELDKRLDAAAIDVNRGAVHWDILKRCRSLVAMNHNFSGSSSVLRKEQVAKMDANSKEKHLMHKTLKDQSKVEVHVVDWGGEWVDVRPLTEDRLLRQMNDCGWGWGDHEPGDRVDEDEWADVPLAKQFKRLVAAAKLNRHEYRFPRIRVILHNMTRQHTDVSIFLDQMLHLDESVEVTIDDASSPFLKAPLPPADTAIDNLIGNELENLTSTLNLDHTILIDLISDISHFDLEPQPWQASTTQAQILEEKRHGGLMAPTLYPLLKDRTLVCTREGAEHFHEVLRTVGTDTEKERGRLLVPWDDATRSMTPEAIRARFCSLSVHPPPDDVQLPIQIADREWNSASIEAAVAEGSLPAVALDVARKSNLKGSKLSIYTYGWLTGFVTLTSNKEVRGQIRTWLEANRRSDDDLGPRIWRVDVTRNLLAKSATPREVE